MEIAQQNIPRKENVHMSEPIRGWVELIKRAAREKKNEIHLKGDGSIQIKDGKQTLFLPESEVIGDSKPVILPQFGRESMRAIKIMAGMNLTVTTGNEKGSIRIPMDDVEISVKTRSYMEQTEECMEILLSQAPRS